MKSILVVDDAKSMRELVKGILENEGYSVVTAADGVEGLALAREKRFDAAVVDLHMPNMNGISMVDKIRRGTESTDAAVLMLTTETSDYRKQKARGVGANGWLSKPFDPPRLVSAVNKLIEKHEKAS